MHFLQSIQIDERNNEEILPSFTPEFPYIATCAELSRYADSITPWHWHRPVELFYIKSGSLEYTTPGGHWKFPTGSGGFVNSNILHSTTFRRQDATVQLLHIFDPAFLAGEAGSLVAHKYILPLTTSGIELIPLFPNIPEQSEILQDILAAFALDEALWGYEFKLRNLLTDIWLKLLALAQTIPAVIRDPEHDDSIKKILIYIHEHYPHPISVEELANSVSVSRRTCFRLFQEQLHTTPLDYIRSYRLQQACRMLSTGQESVTQIAFACGFGTSSYFGKIFHECYGCTPGEYRKMWHDRNILQQESDSNPGVTPLY